MATDFEWLDKNGFDRIERGWASTEAEADFYDTAWYKLISCLPCRLFCLLTWDMKTDTWEGEVYAEDIADWINHKKFEVKADTAEKAYDDALEKWREFIRLLNEG